MDMYRVARNRCCRHLLEYVCGGGAVYFSFVLYGAKSCWTVDEHGTQDSRVVLSNAILIHAVVVGQICLIITWVRAMAMATLLVM